jgi:hypothetical protein
MSQYVLKEFFRLPSNPHLHCFVAPLLPAVSVLGELSIPMPCLTLVSVDIVYECRYIGVMANWWNGRMAEWHFGGIAEWQNGRMAEREWHIGGMAHRWNGTSVEWHIG